MRFLFCFIISILFSMCLLHAQEIEKFSLPKECTDEDYIAGKAIVKFKSEVRDREKNDLFNSLLYKIGADSAVQKFPNSRLPKEKYNELGMPFVDISGIYEIYFSEDLSIEEIINTLMKSNIFEYVYPHYIDKPLYVPNDPNISSQYYLDKIKAYDAWDICKGSEDRVIGIIDTGYEFNHPDLVNAVKYNYNDTIDGIDNDNDGYVDNFMGWDLGSFDNDPQFTSHSHGVHVSGLAGATADNGFGIAGVGFNSKLLPVKVSNDNGYLVASYDGIIYAADHGANVINCSWGSTYSGNLYGQDIIDYATINCNALVVAACGNDNNEVPFYPASYKYVLSVAGSDINDHKLDISTYNYLVDIVAPGKSIYSTWIGASFTSSGGTSMAAPIVSGAAAIVSSHFPELNMLQVAERLRTTADVIDTISENSSYYEKLGKGRLNLYRALTDTFSSSVRLIKWDFSDSADMDFGQNDTIYFNAKIINYLAPTNNLFAKLECLNPRVMLIDSIWDIGNLNTLAAANNYENPFKFKLLNVLPSEKIEFRIYFFDGDYYSFDYVSINVNKDYKTLDTNNITVTITSAGNFGYNDLIYLTQGDGFRYKNGANLVSGFGFMCGTGPSRVADNLYGIVNPVDKDFSSNGYVLNMFPPPFGDKCYFSSYSDKGEESASNLNVEIRQFTYGWNTLKDKNYFIIDYNIINDTTEAYNNFYAGLFADWDIIISNENRCWYDPDLNLLITTDIDSSVYVAIGLLSDYSAIHYASDLNGFNNSISLTDGFSGLDKYNMMKTNRFASGTDFSGNDVAAMVSSGPHVVEAKDTLKLSFVVLAGRSISELEEGIVRANEQYENINKVNYNISEYEAFIYPNPASDVLFYSFKEDVDAPVEISIMDINGKEIFKTSKKSSSGSLDLKSYSEGLYFITFFRKNMYFVQKLLIKR
ncbi:MAG: S8 family serine peptidase [Bacteroidales bacterium]|nr:S8 family serine peptidase [Bacteroidales bacterium]